VEVYKSAAGFTDISSESNLFLEKVKETDSKLNEVDIQVKVLEGVEKFLNTPGSNVSSVTSMINDPSLSLLTNKLSELELQREKYARTVQAGNPLLETVNTQVANTKDAIRENINNQKKGLIISRTNLASLNRSIESSIRGIPKKEREFVSIKRQQGIKESLYLLLLQKKEETAISYASTVSDSRLIDEAFVSPAPIKPNSRTIYLIALLIGLGIPIVIINIKALLNNKITSRAELEQRTNGIPILGEVGDKPKSIAGPLLDTKSNNFIAEQFRILRTNLQYLIQGQKACKKILFTSSISGEGKSFIAMNLAASLASAGQKVILINLDIRKPKLHEYLKLSNNIGIVNYLIGQGKAADFVQMTPVENLSFVASGPIPPNPAELLSSTKLAEFIAEVEKDYQYILIDCSPNGLVTDAQLAAPLVDATVFIVRHEYTPQGAMLPLFTLYKEKKFPALTVIYNGVRGSSSYGYGYGYSYYGESANPSIWSKLKGVFM
jgi:tyrosine-protein kinase Etk/Wzc